MSYLTEFFFSFLRDRFPFFLPSFFFSFCFFFFSSFLPFYCHWEREECLKAMLYSEQHIACCWHATCYRHAAAYMPWHRKKDMKRVLPSSSFLPEDYVTAWKQRKRRLNRGAAAAAMQATWHGWVGSCCCCMYILLPSFLFLLPSFSSSRAGMDRHHFLPSFLPFSFLPVTPRLLTERVRRCRLPFHWVTFFFLTGSYTYKISLSLAGRQVACCWLISSSLCSGMACCRETPHETFSPSSSSLLLPQVWASLPPPPPYIVDARKACQACCVHAAAVCYGLGCCRHGMHGHAQAGVAGVLPCHRDILPPRDPDRTFTDTCHGIFLFSSASFSHSPLLPSPELPRDPFWPCCS